MRLNIAGGHALGVHGQDLLLDVLTDAGLVFLQHMRLEFPLTIPGHGYLHITEAGAQRFAAVPVPAVVRVLVFIVIPAVAQFVVQLSIKAVFHELGNRLFEQALDVVHAADVRHLQQFADFFPPGFFLRRAIFSGHMYNLLCNASILHHSGGLHII